MPTAAKLVALLSCFSVHKGDFAPAPLSRSPVLAAPDASLRDGNGIRAAAPAVLTPSPFKGAVQNHTVKEPGIQPTAQLYFAATDPNAKITVVIGAQSERVAEDGSIPPIPIRQESTTLVPPLCVCGGLGATSGYSLVSPCRSSV